MKKCSKCNELLNENCFGPANGGRYLRPECRKCNNLLSKKRKALKEKYAPPNENHVCPICLRNKNELLGTGGKAGVWVNDHNHFTDAFRGHICHQCNRGIGLFKDDVVRLKRCVEYLNKNNN
jgi:hypothetical protein